MSYTESEMDCDDCGSGITNGEKCYCNSCFENLQTEKEELTDEVTVLKDTIDDLENEISELKSENIGAGLEALE